MPWGLLRVWGETIKILRGVEMAQGSTEGRENSVGPLEIEEMS